MTIRAYAATEAGGALGPFEYDPGALGREEVEIKVISCGICHSDLSMLDNDWGMSEFPFVPGHEAVGTIEVLGEGVTHLSVGQRIGLGWFSGSCMTCHECMRGQHNLCAMAQATIIGRHGGFADRVRCKSMWAVPLPDGVDAKKAGPLFCGGITVFSPIMRYVRPTDRVGVVGIGGLGHMALSFLNKWGCEVVAFTSSEAKVEEAKRLGAHSTINSRSSEALEKAAGSFDVILSTVNVTLDWDGYINALKPDGRLHTVGAVAEPIAVTAFPMLVGRKSLSASPLGSPAEVETMLEFCGRHGIEPVTQHYPMSKVNDALQDLRDGKARYRIVLDAD